MQWLVTVKSSFMFPVCEYLDIGCIRITQYLCPLHSANLVESTEAKEVLRYIQ